MRGKITKRKTDEEFRSELLSINSAIIPLEPYINGRTKILCRCDSCGYEWSPTPNNLLQGSGCPKCRLEQRNRSFTKTKLRISRSDGISEPVSNATRALCHRKDEASLRL